jgi:hypothetical protein
LRLYSMIARLLALAALSAGCRFDLADVVEEDAGAVAGEVSLWRANIPMQAVAEDPTPVELGVRFRSDVAGSITGIRFFRGAASNEGPHTGRLWTATGALLDTAAFDLRGVGWQSARFARPVRIQPGTTYVASYFAPKGRYSIDKLYFAKLGHRAGPLEALADGTDGPNGVFRNGTGFPAETFMSSNYWVDVLFVPAP